MFFKDNKKEGYRQGQGSSEEEQQEFVPSGTFDESQAEDYETSKSYEEEHEVSSGMSGGFSANSQESYEAAHESSSQRVMKPAYSPPSRSLTLSPPRSDSSNLPSSGSVSESPDAIVMEFRKMDAKINSIVDWITQFYERFAPAVDSMRRLRSKAVESEENINKALKDSARAIELASKVDIENLRMVSQKVDTRTEDNKREIKRLSEEVDSLNERAQVFISTEELLRLNDDVRNNLSQIKKIDAELRERADRMEKLRKEIGSALEFKKEIENSEALIQKTAILAKQNNEAIGNFTFEEYQEKVDTIMDVIEKLAQEISGLKKELGNVKEEVSYKSMKKKNEVMEALEDIGEIPQLPELPTPKAKKQKKKSRR